MANEIFDLIKSLQPNRSKFNLTHENKFTGKIGQLIPFYHQDVIPGDYFHNDTEALVRFMPMIAPVMHQIDFKTEFFFVPNRIIWKQWVEFITGGVTGNSRPKFPTINLSEWYREPPINVALPRYWLDVLGKSSLWDYFGFPPYIYYDKNEGGEVEFQRELTRIGEFSLLPFLAYFKIWLEYYRDRNIESTVPGFIDNYNFDEFIWDNDHWFSETEPDLFIPETFMKIRSRSFEKDYFTSALPFAQRGEPIVVPFEGQLPVELKTPHSGVLTSPHDLVAGQVIETGDDSHIRARLNSETYTNIAIDPNGSLMVDLANATGLDIVTLRAAFAAQRFQERLARSGNRYKEFIASFFDEYFPDGTAQRPIYLGGGSQPIRLSEVLQTSETSEQPLGQMAGHGISAGMGHKFKQKFVEYGQIIGIASIVPKPSYNYQCPRKYFKFDKFDYAISTFEHIGEQEITKKEVSIDTEEPNEIFGYQSRFAEYKYEPSRVAGEFHDELDFWHQSRFIRNPELNEDFLHINGLEMNRIFNVQMAEEDTILVQTLNKTTCERNLSKYSEPGLIDHM